MPSCMAMVTNMINKKSFSSLHTLVAVSMIGLFAGMHGVALADVEGTVDLIITPPELTATVAPNVVLTYDDSGSMTWHHMPDQRPYTGVRWGWSGNTPQGEEWNSTYPEEYGPYLCAGVIDPDAGSDDPRSWSMNGVYYNPNAVYRPPLMEDGSSFPDADFTRAWRNGIRHNRPNDASTSPVYDLSMGGSTEEVCTGSGRRRQCRDVFTPGEGQRFCGNLPGYYKLADGVELTLGSDGKLNAASLNGLYNASNWDWVDLPEAQRQNFANWFSYYHTRQIAAISATSHAFAEFDKSIRIAWQNINANTDENPRVRKNTTVLQPFVGDTREKFYDWLFSNPASGGTPNQAATKRVGELFTGGRNVRGAKNPYWDEESGLELSCRKNFHILMTDGMWNGTDATVDNTDNDAVDLPDGRTYSTSADETKIYWNEDGADKKSMADIAFHYWATDLRDDFKNDPRTTLKVRPYLADSTTGVTGSVSLAPGDDWLDNEEIYWNPANNPATWPHLVQYMIGFGVDGTIPSTDANLKRLREGTIKWPGMPSSDTAEKIDDMWHAAINSRGQFFATSSPDELVEAMRKIIISVVSQTSSRTPAAASLPLLAGSNSAYVAGFDSTSWSGSLERFGINQETGMPTGAPMWDAGCLLTGGDCSTPAGTPRGPDNRSIVSWKSGTDGGGIPFAWSNLTADQKTGLELESDSDDGTEAEDRVKYLRGDRSKEAADATPRLKRRASLLGAIVNGQPIYVSSPRSGYKDIFPAGSPEMDAALADEANSYAGYQRAYRDRAPMVYAGANDGMLHAFNAESGKEEWAYVPSVLIENGRLADFTTNPGLVPGVDAMPRERDVFIDGKWRTVLVGSLRLGGRGVYALDVTEPSFADQNAVASAVPLWEFSSGSEASAADDPPCAAGSTTCASLGYTYDSVNIARIKHDNKWVALVSSGYFPEDKNVAAKDSDATEAAAKRTSLLVIDLETGKLIRELRTSEAPQTRPSGFKTFGLSTPMVYDLGSDEVDDLVYAGDLAGNLWRFNLSSADTSDWSVDLMFTTYGSGGTGAVGDQPIVFNPTALVDPATRSPMLVFGTGKYLGETDRTSVTEQAFYGIRDYGDDSDHYPMTPGQLVTQKLEQETVDGLVMRKITGWAEPSATLPEGVPPIRLGKLEGGVAVTEYVPAHGWRMPLKVGNEAGERANQRAVPFFSSNMVGLYTLIPDGTDPCNPGARYAVMFVDAATGGRPIGSGGQPAGTRPGAGVVGLVSPSEIPPGDPMTIRGGGGVVVPGLPALPPGVISPAPVWHRTGWRDLIGAE